MLCYKSGLLFPFVKPLLSFLHSWRQLLFRVKTGKQLKENKLHLLTKQTDTRAQLSEGHDQCKSCELSEI